MIQLEITSSPDKNILCNFKFCQNEIYLGHSSGNLQINDPALRESHVMIEVIEQDLIIHPQKGVESYLINGKRASTIRKIKIGQEITIGATTLKIRDFQESAINSKKKVLDEKLSQLIAENSPRLIVIEKLAKMMK